MQRLQTLATQLEQGTIFLGDEAFPAPEQVRLEVKAGSKELDIELGWKASAREERSEQERRTRPEEHAPFRSFPNVGSREDGEAAAPAPRARA